MHRFRRRLHAWFAIFAILAGALAPAASRAFAAERGGAFVLELCSAMGTHRVELSAAEAAHYAGVLPQDTERQDGDVAKSCPYCCTHGASLGLPPAEAGARDFAFRAAADAVPRLFLVAPRPPFAWSPSRPRAPPGAA